MTENDNGSVYEQYAATSAGATDLAAAKISRQVSTLISQALASSPRGQRELASILGVSEARVSQVVNGDGNLRVGAVAKYMRALGYELRLIATAVEEGLPNLPKASTGRPRRRKREVPSPSGVGQFQYLYTFEAEPVEESDLKSVTGRVSSTEPSKRIFFEAGSGV